MNNPKVRKGDLVIMTKNGNGYHNWIDVLLEVISVCSNGSNFNVKCVSGVPAGSLTLYQTSDTFMLADRKAQAKHLRKVNTELRDTIAINIAEIYRLEKFESEEEFVAYKIDKLMRTKGVKAKAMILKELKKSSYL